ncbi:hypothetical protein J8273_2807 [Carpediemonas membranifera]|uniref:Uncharacterized protein n=1 Tax=Carpediemonas membranifera TaxID=201153 RepID=A0A8J6B9K5_9EUKA|nr:hypothetical protein J8273_2807 [Carpediemonas membranifera]|eukprot:KAG9395612.1 hypothetical protein J8273_2807 [Carpediemonas membranifera]
MQFNKPTHCTSYIDFGTEYNFLPTSVSFSTEGRYFAVGGSFVDSKDTGEPDAVLILDAFDQFLVRKINVRNLAQDDPLEHLAFGQSNATIFTLSRFGKLSVWAITDPYCDPVLLNAAELLPETERTTSVSQLTLKFENGTPKALVTFLNQPPVLISWDSSWNLAREHLDLSALFGVDQTLQDVAASWVDHGIILTHAATTDIVLLDPTTRAVLARRKDPKLRGHLVKKVVAHGPDVVILSQSLKVYISTIMSYRVTQSKISDSTNLSDSTAQQFYVDVDLNSDGSYALGITAGLISMFSIERGMFDSSITGPEATPYAKTADFTIQKVSATPAMPPAPPMVIVLSEGVAWVLSVDPPQNFAAYKPDFIYYDQNRAYEERETEFDKEPEAQPEDDAEKAQEEMDVRLMGEPAIADLSGTLRCI